MRSVWSFFMRLDNELEIWIDDWDMFWTIDLSTIANLELTWCLMIWSNDCLFSLMYFLCWHSDLQWIMWVFNKKNKIIYLLFRSTMAEVLIVTIQHENGTYMTHSWCIHLHIVTKITCIMIMRMTSWSFKLILHGWLQLLGRIINKVKTSYNLSVSPAWKNWYCDIDNFDNGYDLASKLWWDEFLNMMVQN